MRTLTVTGITGIGEVRHGDDLATLVAERHALVDGEVVVLTSKVVSKAEGRVLRMARDDAVTRETSREVARRGATRIVRHRLGVVLAAAGVDASNTPVGTVVLLPSDPDASARGLRDRLLGLTGANVAVVVTDTAGRAWRHGQTDLAVGVAGLRVLDDHAGLLDAFGNALAVTAPALADEVAAAADLVKGKLLGVPVAVVTGLEWAVLGPRDHGVGAAGLVRDEASDMFGLGAREAVMAALRGADPRGFGAPAEAAVVHEALRSLVGGAAGVSLRDSDVEVVPDGPLVAGAVEARACAAAHAHGWVRADGQGLRFRMGP